MKDSNVTCEHRYRVHQGGKRSLHLHDWSLIECFDYEKKVHDILLAVRVCPLKDRQEKKEIILSFLSSLCVRQTKLARTC